MRTRGSAATASKAGLSDSGRGGCGRGSHGRGRVCTQCGGATVHAGIIAILLALSLNSANRGVVRAVGIALEHVTILRAEARVIGGCAGVDLTLDGGLAGVENAVVTSVTSFG